MNYDPVSDKIPSSRSDNSLYTLTGKFLDIIKGSSNGCVDLNQAADVLGVSKRRIYDITNILNGLGLLKKVSPNNACWIGDVSYLDGVGGKLEKDIFNNQRRINENNFEWDVIKSQIGSRLMSLDNKIKKLKEIEEKLDDEISSLNNDINEMAAQEKNLEHAYITYKDLAKLTTVKNKLVLAVKAPPNTTLEYPRFENDEHIIELNGNGEKIGVYYVSEENLNED
ncbi:Transcription factor E2F3 [Astathelohania contejeani]|uniref:Transcription factor E2F3 n=1 Tax=Astathelohania contejeani TaxID=164912 RepID=A0ABQ7I255_9MICR|nr:Transcription factor E2F3 [Thelohania contejeani]